MFPIALYLGNAISVGASKIVLKEIIIERVGKENKWFVLEAV